MVASRTILQLVVVIIDTFNVLHAAGKAGMGRLTVGMLRGLIEISRWRGEHVVLVSDGPGPPGGEGRRTLRRGEDAGPDLPANQPGVSEVFAASGGAAHSGAGSRSDADGVIEALLEREEGLGRGRQVLVVSSDKRVRAAAVGVRARGLSSEDFLDKLAEDARKSRARAVDQTGGRPDFAQDGGMDAGRTKYWLREFAEPAPAAEPGKPYGPASAIHSPEPRPEDVDMEKILKSGTGKQAPERG